MVYELKFKRPEWNGYKKLIWPGCKENLAEVETRIRSRGYDYVITIDGKIVDSYFS